MHNEIKQWRWTWLKQAFFLHSFCMGLVETWNQLVLRGASCTGVCLFRTGGTQPYYAGWIQKLSSPLQIHYLSVLKIAFISTIRQHKPSTECSYTWKMPDTDGHKSSLYSGNRYLSEKHSLLYKNLWLILLFICQFMRQDFACICLMFIESSA